MTAPKDRPEWMPSSKEINAAAGGIAELEPHFDSMLHRTGLRAQLAVLEKMAKEVCYGCRHEEPVVKIMGSTYHSTGHTAEARESCNSWPITNHIAALRKELEQ